MSIPKVLTKTGNSALFVLPGYLSTFFIDLRIFWHEIRFFAIFGKKNRHFLKITQIRYAVVLPFLIPSDNLIYH